MKKFKILLFSLLFVCVLGFSFNPQKFVHAASSEQILSYNDFSVKIENILNDFCAFKSRSAGSSAEVDASNYIKNYLDANAGRVSAKNDDSTVNGVQKFKFKSKYTGLYLESQNIIYSYSPTTESDKKVVVVCNYDAPCKFDNELQEYVAFNNDALNYSASGVASALILAETLPEYNPSYNIEFVFLGASNENGAGAEYYTTGISADDAKNILCVINIDKVALGGNLYFYIDEIETKFSKYVSSSISGWAKQINLAHVSKTEYIENDLNLPYSHVGMNDENTKFMKRGIPTINFFAGSYDEGIVVGLNEYDGRPPITYTDNDTIEYIKQNFGENAIAENLYKVNISIENLLRRADFVEKTSKSYNQTAWFYKIFANTNLVTLVTIVSFIVVLIFAMKVYYDLTIKSYYANVEVEFLSSVVKIADQIDDGKQNKDVAKAVGQVLASDIKKNKTLSPEKKKKDK